MKVVRLLWLMLLTLTACGGGGEPTPQESRPVVFFGDSIISRWDTAAAFSGEETVNLGVGGDRTSMMLHRFDTVLRLNPRVLILNGGVNDANHDLATDGVAHLRAMVTASPAVTTIVLGTTSINDAGDGRDTAALREVLRRFDDQLARMCAELGCIHVDLRSVSTLPDGSLDPSLAVDFIHPNAKFYDIIAGKIAPLLRG